MTKGAVHPNGSSFRRVARLDVVQRMRRLVDTGMINYPQTGKKADPNPKPRWLPLCEEVPPMENHNLNYQAKDVRSPYPQMLNFVLKKYPDLRFQDVYVDGNDWSVGNDTYRADHPAMQFVARQLQYMRNENLSKREAFKKTEDFFRQRRMKQELEQKVLMATMMNQSPETKSVVQPMFTTGQAYAQAEQARKEAAILEQILQKLRSQKQSTDAWNKQEAKAEEDFDIKMVYEAAEMKEQAETQAPEPEKPKIPSSAQAADLFSPPSEQQDVQSAEDTPQEFVADRKGTLQQVDTLLKRPSRPSGGYAGDYYPDDDDDSFMSIRSKRTLSRFRALGQDRSSRDRDEIGEDGDDFDFTSTARPKTKRRGGYGGEDEP